MVQEVKSIKTDDDDKKINNSENIQTELFNKDQTINKHPTKGTIDLLQIWDQF